jgi:hypothetical protein
VYDFDVPIEVVFISEAHDAVLALIIFDAGVGDHVAFEV